MVHNGIEYGLMAAYAVGLNVLQHADIGKRSRAASAETTALADPEDDQYALNIRDIAKICRRGSVIRYWLLDLTSSELAQSPDLAATPGVCPTPARDAGQLRPQSRRFRRRFSARRCTNVFTSRGEADFADKLLSAMRHGFGGHLGLGATHDTVEPQ
jgi:6-phosphogluconate dehydrogenase